MPLSWFKKLKIKTSKAPPGNADRPISRRVQSSDGLTYVSAPCPQPRGEQETLEWMRTDNEESLHGILNARNAAAEDKTIRPVPRVLLYSDSRRSSYPQSTSDHHPSTDSLVLGREYEDVLYSPRRSQSGGNHGLPKDSTARRSGSEQARVEGEALPSCEVELEGDNNCSDSLSFISSSSNEFIPPPIRDLYDGLNNLPRLLTASLTPITPPKVPSMYVEDDPASIVRPASRMDDYSALTDLINEPFDDTYSLSPPTPVSGEDLVVTCPISPPPSDDEDPSHDEDTIQQLKNILAEVSTPDEEENTDDTKAKKGFEVDTDHRMADVKSLPLYKRIATVKYSSPEGKEHLKVIREALGTGPDATDMQIQRHICNNISIVRHMIAQTSPDPRIRIEYEPKLTKSWWNVVVAIVVLDWRFPVLENVLYRLLRAQKITSYYRKDAWEEPRPRAYGMFCHKPRPYVTEPSPLKLSFTPESMIKEEAEEEALSVEAVAAVDGTVFTEENASAFSSDTNDSSIESFSGSEGSSEEESGDESVDEREVAEQKDDEKDEEEEKKKIKEKFKAEIEKRIREEILETEDREKAEEMAKEKKRIEDAKNEEEGKKDIADDSE